jgi:hypothetical protein
MAGRDPTWTQEFEPLLLAYAQSGGHPSFFRTPCVANVAVGSNWVLGAHQVPDADLETWPVPDGAWARTAITPGMILEHPIHPCFVALPAEGIQQIIFEFDLERAAEVEVIAHSHFPKAIKLQHRMEAHIHVGPQALFSYTGALYHGPHGGIQVGPAANSQWPMGLISLRLHLAARPGWDSEHRL